MRCLSILLLTVCVLPFLGCDVNVHVDGSKDGEGSSPSAGELTAVDEPATDSQATADAVSSDDESSDDKGEIFGLSLPGVDVNVSDTGGVKVRAPGVNVDVSEKDGVKVKAPGTDVELKPADGN